MGWASTLRGVPLLALGAFVLATFAWVASSATALPAPEQLVPNTVARISDVLTKPGTITRAEFRHALVLAAAGANRAAPRPGEAEYDELAENATTGLIEAVWLTGQAAEMDIVVSHREVVRERTRIKKENFASPAEFRGFLRYSRLTRRDLYDRVELQILAVRIQERVLAGVKSEAEEQKVFTKFLDEFNEKWRARTVCAPEHAVAHCSNGPERDS